MNTQAAWSGVRDRVTAVVEAERRARGQGPSQLPVFEPVLSAAEIAEVEAQLLRDLAAVSGRSPDRVRGSRGPG
ncbi:hypothetical protein [Streptacidiphilus sp. EB103A]|uniref:hypothetical protein n=1 Tax=Streptacidiphilus sp. EB103A TaxID=3156275 RepID=UPI0035118D2C